MHGYTDEMGRFQLYGTESEMSSIDPILKIYHDCNDHGVVCCTLFTFIYFYLFISFQPCQRKWAITLPDKYISAGTVPLQTIYLGVMNLEVELDGESTDCIH
jgi:hypothetical protein